MKYYKAKIVLENVIRSSVEKILFEEYACTGSLELDIQEEEIDKILGKDSFCGGSLPDNLIQKIEEAKSKNSLLIEYFFENIDEGTREEIIQRLSFLDPRPEVLFELIENQDWNSEWKKTYKPIEVNDHCHIIPSFLSEDHPYTGKELYIYPGMGFGTGDHPTTFLCLESFFDLLSKDNEDLHILDFGCGSGILGLAPLRFFNSTVCFYDIDEDALKNCQQNIELNFDSPPEENIALMGPRQKNLLSKEYDLVFANILQNVLFQEKDFIFERLKPGANLILSGLLKDQLEETIEVYSNLGLNYLFKKERGDWGALVFKNE